MKRLLLASVVVVIVLAVRLVQLVREPSEPVKLVARRSPIVLATGSTMTARVEVPTDKPVEMGLPAWTELLTTMPSSPPPIDTQPPTVPAAALR
ncbi:MAG TPA: hypothetical protein VF403_11440 [Kofleriaceae bacterium]